MTWTYSGDPGSSTRDLVRFLIGDTDTTDQLLTNEEIDYLITTFTDGYSAAIGAVNALIAKFARQVDESKKVADLSLSRSLTARVAQYTTLRDTLTAERARRFTASPVVNPNAIVPTSEKDLAAYPPGTDFTVGQFDNLT